MSKAVTLFIIRRGLFVKRHFEKKRVKHGREVIARFVVAFVLAIFLELGLAQVMCLAATDVAAKPGVELKADPKKVPTELEGVGIQEHLGQTLTLAELQFIDSNDGQKHPLQDYFKNGKPVLMNLVYFECPMLCTLVLNGVTDGIKQLDASVGKDFNVVTVSINPNDTPDIAKVKRENYIKSYLEKGHNSESANLGWHFLTGSEDQIKKLAAQLGFEYKYDTYQKQYAHPAVTFVLTPTGEISRYLYGITYKPRDLKLALLEASQEKIGNVFDRVLMFCYHYEPSSRGYALQAIRVMQAASVATLAFFGGFLALFWTRQRKGRTK